MTNKMRPLARKKEPQEKFSFYVYVVMRCSSSSSNFEMIDKIFRWKEDAEKYCKEQKKQYGEDSHYIEKVGVR